MRRLFTPRHTSAIATVLLLLLLLLYYQRIIRGGNGAPFFKTFRTSMSSNVAKTEQHDETPTSATVYRHKDKMIVAVVVCGDRLHEALTMLKSAVMFGEPNIHFIVVSDDALIQSFVEKLQEWQSMMSNSFTFEVIPLTFPKDDAEEWRKLFKPCASQRLFLPSVLNDIDSILYVDTDTLFLGPVKNMWQHFENMNSSQMAALAPEHEDTNVGWYNRFAMHPYYGKLGVNSGVMLMNLTRMRDFLWDEYVIPVYKRFKLQITWGDQDIINIIFHYHPTRLYIYSCRYNFRPDHCMYVSVCRDAVENGGVQVLHGSRGFFHSNKQPIFQSIYRAFEEFQLGGDFGKDFLQPLETYLELTSETTCSRNKEIFLRNLRQRVALTKANTQ